MNIKKKTKNRNILLPSPLSNDNSKKTDGRHGRNVRNYVGQIQRWYRDCKLNVVLGFEVNPYLSRFPSSIDESHTFESWPGSWKHHDTDRDAAREKTAFRRGP